MGWGPRGDQPRRRGGGRSELISLQHVTTAGPGEIIATEASTLEIFIWGAGASGSPAFNNNRGGGAGGASYKSVRLIRGQRVPYVVGAGGASNGQGGTLGHDGGDSWVLLPSGSLVRAGGGKGLGAGGDAIGGHLNLSGSPSGTSNSSGGTAPSFAGYSSFVEFMGGIGSAFGTGSAAGGSPGGGSGGSDGGGPSGAGGVGRLIYALHRIV
ncbi:glycine-rich domain-containing protein [Phenylobacterium sp.]|uniref:glycine-rich domain-containing protein n=1 Tax=Phenylobacterium sp. TaxID=1871053 RepID=UPI004035C1DC